MKQTLLAALHLLGAVLFLVFMIARTAQATGLTDPQTPPEGQGPDITMERLAPSAPDLN